MKEITVFEIGDCIAEALKNKKRNILFVSKMLEYNNALDWFAKNPSYRVFRDVPATLYEEKNGVLVRRDEYTVIDSQRLKDANNENSIWFINAFSEKALKDFEGFMNIVKDRFYINRFPDGSTEKRTLEKMALFIAFTTPADGTDWAALDEKYYEYFDEVYLL